MKRGFRSRSAQPNVCRSEIGLRYKPASTLPAISHSCEERPPTEGPRGRATRNPYRLRYSQSVTGASSTVNADGVRPLTRDSKPQSLRPSCPWLLQNEESHAKPLSDTVSPTVDVLRERSVLTVFTTGHETLVLPETHASMPRCKKSVDMRPPARALTPLGSLHPKDKGGRSRSRPQRQTPPRSP